MIDTIPLDQLENRRAYKLKSRNLMVGFWDAERQGFIGVREKFRDRFLFTEFHWDYDERLGTAIALEATDLVLPEDIPLVEYLDLACQFCGVPAEKVWEYDEEVKRNRCIGDRHLEDTDCKPDNPYFAARPMNQAAFDLLEPLDRQFYDEFMKDDR